MSNYSKTTDFAAKDSLPSGDSGKIIRGSEFETEFDAISTAIATKADAASPTFTGTVTIDGLTVNGNTVLGNAATDTVTVTADIASNLIPSADDTYNLGASGAEWNDLFIDGTANIDSLVAGSGSFTSISTTGNVTFGDNDKAIFGAGNDLQIYHDGSHSYIEDASGTGNVKFRTNTLRIENAAGTELSALFVQDGAATLYNNNSAKLATTSTGVDVTGTVVADGLTVDSNVVGIGTSSPDDVGSRTTLHINHNTNGAAIRLSEGAVNNAFLSYDDSEGFRINSVDTLDLRTNNLDRLDIASNGDISFYEDTGTTAKFFWDASAERLGIGTASPERSLHVKSSASLNAGLIESTSTTSSLLCFANNGTAATNTVRAGSTDNAFVIHTNSSGVGTERFRIDSSGNVGIGTTSPNSILEIAATSNGGDVEGIRLTNSSTTANSSSSIMFNTSTGDVDSAKISSTRIDGSNNDLRFLQRRGGALTEAMRIDKDGNVGIGTANPQSKLQVDGTFTATGNIFLHEATASSSNAVEIGRNRTVDGAVFLDFITSTSESDFNFRLNRGSGTNGALQIRNRGTGAMEFLTNDSEAMRIDSSGNLLVGKTSGAFGTAGSALYSGGLVQHTKDGASVLQINRLSSDGVIQTYNKDGNTVGEIGSFAGDMIIGLGDHKLRFFDGSNAISPCVDAGTINDNAIDLGVANSRFRNLYLSGGAYLGGTAAANKLDDYEEGTWTPVLSDGTNTVTLASGTYTKVGRVVTCVVSDFNENTSSLSGNVKITGLPFTSSGKDQGVPLYYRDGGTAGESVIGFIAQAGSEMQIRENRGTALTAVNITATAATTIISTFSYQTA